MKTIYGAALAAAILAAGTFSASAMENDAFCATMKGGQNAGKLHCAYNTMAQCEEAVKGGMGTCSKNDKMKK